MALKYAGGYVMKCLQKVPFARQPKCPTSSFIRPKEWGIKIYKSKKYSKPISFSPFSDRWVPDDPN
jgi:hypothetical protein